MDKFRVTKSQIILAGPSTGKTEVVNKYPSIFVDQDNIFRLIDASYFRTRRDLMKGDPKELEKYILDIDMKFVKEALAYLRDEKVLLLSRLTQNMIPKFFAFIPNAKIHLMVWRDNPQEVFKIMKSRDGDSGPSFEEIDKWYKAARSAQFAEATIWLKNGQYLENVLDIPGAKQDELTKEANTKLAKAQEEASRENDVINAAKGDDDGNSEESQEES